MTVCIGWENIINLRIIFHQQRAAYMHRTNQLDYHQDWAADRYAFGTVVVVDESTKKEAEGHSKYDEIVLNVEFVTQHILVTAVQLLHIYLHTRQRLTKSDHDGPDRK